MTQAHDTHVARFTALFGATDDHGHPRYRRADLLAFLPVLMANLGMNFADVPGLSPLLAECFSVLGITHGMSADAMKSRLDVYFAHNPGPTLLYRELLGALNQQGVDVKNASEKLSTFMVHASALNPSTR